MILMPIAPTEPSSEPPSDFVQSFARGLAVIRAFDAENPRLTLSDVARRAEIPRAAASRFLRTLEHVGYVHAHGGVFTLTPRVLELGMSYLSALTLPDLALPHLEALSRRSGESASLGVLDGADIVYVARVAARRIMSIGISVGTRFPAHATSIGRVLLAGLPEPELDELLEESTFTAFTAQTIMDPRRLRDEIQVTRTQGWALVDGELEEGLRSIAAPVHDRRGTVVGAVNLATASARSDLAVVTDELLPLLLRTTASIDEDLRLL